jgi:hypothetical protein
VTEPRADGVDVHAGAEQEYGRRVPHPNYVVKSERTCRSVLSLLRRGNIIDLATLRT